MKKIALLTILFLLTATSQTFASEATQSATPSSIPKTVTPIEKKAQDLLDRVATKVAQLADAKKRTYRGVVSSAGTNSYTISSPEGNLTVNTSGATEYFRIKAGKTSETNFAGIKKGDDIVAIGTIDPADRSMTAKQIITKIKRTIFYGPITAAEKNVITIDGTKIDLKDASYEQLDLDTGKIAAAKVSDFQTGKTAFVLAHSPENGVYSSLKALIISNGQ